MANCLLNTFKLRQQPMPQTNARANAARFGNGASPSPTGTPTLSSPQSPSFPTSKPQAPQSRALKFGTEGNTASSPTVSPPPVSSGQAGSGTSASTAPAAPSFAGTNEVRYGSTVGAGQRFSALA